VTELIERIVGPRRDEIPVDSKTLHRFWPEIAEHAVSAALNGEPPEKFLAVTMADLYGEGRTREERWLFALKCAPIVRKLILHRAGEKIGKYTTKQLEETYGWLDEMDPLAARVNDLYYFVRMGVREIAAILDLPKAAIVRELRFTRAMVDIPLVEEIKARAAPPLKLMHLEDRPKG
jgi:hypothetical protein